MPKVVFIKCELGAQIVPAGWSNWSGTQRDKTAYYAEYGNTGPGADVSQQSGLEPSAHKRGSSKIYCKKYSYSGYFLWKNLLKSGLMVKNNSLSETISCWLLITGCWLNQFASNMQLQHATFYNEQHNEKNTRFCQFFY